MGVLTNLFGRHSADDRLLSGELSSDTGQGKERAEQLLSEHHRAQSAKALRDLVEEAKKPHASFFNANLQVHRMAIRENEALVLSLARELEELEAVNPRGVILADRLIEDGDSPAYAREDQGQFAKAVEQAREALKAE